MHKREIVSTLVSRKRQMGENKALAKGSNYAHSGRNIGAHHAGSTSLAGSPVQAQEQFQRLRVNIARMERQLSKAKEQGLTERVNKLTVMVEDSKAKALLMVQKAARYYNG